MAAEADAAAADVEEDVGAVDAEVAVAADAEEDVNVVRSKI